MMDLAREIGALLREDSKDNTWRQGKLHASSDVVGCVRRACLDLGNEHKRSGSTYQRTRMLIGTGLHKWLQSRLSKNYEILAEVDCEDGLPEGWTGSADILIISKDTDEAKLYDLKIISGAQAFYRDYRSPKVHASTQSRSFPTDEQRWQVSSYAVALKRMGYNVQEAAIVYWPIDKFGYGQAQEFEPFQVDVDLVDEARVIKRMGDVSKVVEQWRATKRLPGFLPAEQKLMGKPTKSPKKFEVHQEIDWRCKWCPFFEVTCNPTHEEGHIGTWVWDTEESGWVFKAEIDGVKPRVAPPGADLDNH